jgi:hypothetical protein
MKNYMRQVMKTILLVAALIFGLLQSTRAYSPGGPIGNNPNPVGPQPGGDSWQQPVIGYGLGGDLNAPKNLGEEYRRNTPVMYYTFDDTFDFFGDDGRVAVSGAFAILNNLTNVSSYSANLSEFPVESRHVNFQAQALGLLDLKSVTLGALMEQMGLADPVRYAWTLHDRFELPNTTCPVGMEYLVVQRNFDFISSPLNQLQYSPYVNNTLYSYMILEECTGPDPLALAVPFAVDPTADTYSPVASYDGGEIAINSSSGLLFDVASGIYSYGSYYSGLTRDDVAGLRYLLQKSNINKETTDLESSLITATTNGNTGFPINSNTPSGFGTFDLGALLSASPTNNGPALEALFPGVIVSSSTPYLGIVTNYTITAYFTNFLKSAVGAPPQLVVITNKSYSVGTFFLNSFANIVTNHYYSNSVETIQTVTVGPRLEAPASSPFVTNVVNKTVVLKGVPSGDYYILPTSPCGLDILNPHYFTNVIVTTNLASSIFGTNAITVTNAIGTTFSFAQIITRTTNYILQIANINCTLTPSPTGPYEGIENIKFVPALGGFDSSLGQFFQPITNNYTLTYVNPTNGQAHVQNFQRIVTTPDFLFSAEDMATGPSSPVHGGAFNISRNLNFDQDNVLAGEAGPGTITSPTTIAFDKSGPVYFNTFGDVMDGLSYFNATPGGDTNDLFYESYFIWASFDGTTNAPIVYPNGTSISNLENQILIQISPTTAPAGTNNVAYTATTFTVTGGSFLQPYTWSASGLPSGLSVASNSDNTATISGTPTQSGTFPFTLTLTDYLSRSVQWNYSLIIQ